MNSVFLPKEKNMSLSLFPTLPINSTFAASPIEASCNAFYGTWERNEACTRAIWNLPGARQRPQKPEWVEFKIGQDPGPYNLPLQVQSGSCSMFPYCESGVRKGHPVG